MAANGRTDEVSGKDSAVGEWIARWGVVPRGAVAMRARSGRTATLGRERRLRKAGLIESKRFRDADTTLLVTTRRGNRFLTDGRLRSQQVSLGTVWHSIATAYVAARLELAGYELLSEQELLADDRFYGDRCSAIQVPAANGRTGHHRPDLLVTDEHSQRAVEVELTPKAPRRLDDLLRAWRLAVIQGSTDGVIYLCPPDMVPVVDRAIVRTMTGESITVQVLDLPELNLPRPTRSISGVDAPVKGRRPDPL